MDEETDKILEEMTERVREVYQQATDEATDRLTRFMEKFEIDDSVMRRQLSYGLIDEDEYNSWYREQMVQSQQYEAVRNTIEADLVNCDQIASSIVNGYLPEVYSINANGSRFDICKKIGYDFDPTFTLYDRMTVEGLIRDGNRLFPQANVDIDADTEYVRKHIHNSITMGILQGESIDNIAKRMEGVSNMSYNSAVRTARTLTTSAQNAGRVDSYNYAKSLGINVEQEWLATLDSKTRTGHRELDGVRVPVGSKFPNGLRYPGDPNGAPSEVYNCRCTLIPYLPDFAEDTNVDRANKLPADYSYDDWKSEHIDKSVVDKINSLENIAMGSLRTPINVVDRKEGHKIQELWNSLNLSETQIESLPIINISPTEVYSWQRVVFKDGLLKMLESDTPHSSDLPIAMVYNGKIVLVDGNHRVALELLRGTKTIPIRVYGEI